MPIIPLNCPNCGASLQVNSEKDLATCEHCNTPFILKDAVMHNYINMVMNVTANTVNVVGTKEYEIVGGVLKSYNGDAVDVVIPDNVIKIDESVFKGLAIRSVKFNPGLQVVGKEAFAHCTSLTSLEFPEPMTKIDDFAFSGCKNINSVKFKSAVSIGWGAFSSCKSLKTISIPSGSQLEKFAFLYAGLVEVDFPDMYGASGLPSSSDYYDSNIYNNDCSNPFVECPVVDNWKIARKQYIEAQEHIEATARADRWMKENKCRYCGGTFSITSKCRQCKKKKDY